MCSSSQRWRDDWYACAMRCDGMHAMTIMIRSFAFTRIAAHARHAKETGIACLVLRSKTLPIETFIWT
jgi:accessory gene regulator protein AgrB